MNDVRNASPASLRRVGLAGTTLALALACNLTPGSTNSDTNDTGNATDDPTGSGNTDTPTGGGPESVTIYDIQKGEVADMTIVDLKDVVVTSPVYTSADGEGNFFISEKDGGEYSGIQVYVYSDVTGELESEGKLPAVGDVLQLRAQYKEFFDYSELTLQAVGDLTITGSGPVPPASTVAAADIATGGPKAENYEGCLVQVENATVTAPVVMYGQFTVDDSLVVDDLFFVPDPGPKPPEGQVFSKLIGQLTYNFEEFKLAPRSCADYEGWDGCDTPDPTTDTNPMCGPGGDVTIFQIQQDEICLQEQVTISGAVVTSGFTFKKDGFFIQDPAGGEYSGIFVFVGADNPNGVAVAPGDIVTVTGAYDEFYGASQIEVAAAADVVVTGAGSLPAPAVVAPADIATGGPKAEAYEGVLVQVEDVTVAANDLGFGEFSVDAELRVDDLFFAMADWPLPDPGAQYTAIAGPLAYTFDTTKIAPRDAADLTPAP
ncbi:MAG: hypothetical protein JNL82_34280 [Myxococcales bacterium]|nr:hypothetical protein [Myxococcales bacterium]